MDEMGLKQVNKVYILMTEQVNRAGPVLTFSPAVPQACKNISERDFQRVASHIVFLHG